MSKPKPGKLKGRFLIMANPTNKTYFVRLERYNFKGKVVGATDLFPSQIKQTMKTMKEYERKGYLPIDELEKGEAYSFSQANEKNC